MSRRNVIWTPVVREKLTQFRSKKFTEEETLDFISQFIIETEELLENNIISKTYTEEYGEYKGITRVVIKKIRIYYKLIDKTVVIFAVLFPGEK